MTMRHAAADARRRGRAASRRWAPASRPPRSRPASMSWRRRSAISATSRCARSRLWRRPTRSSPRTRASPTACSTATTSPTPLVAYHEHNAAEVRPRILARLAAGEALALVSDAGTPLVSDPGYKLVVDAAAAGVAVFALPGPCAAIAALTTAALPTDRFFFEGFLPAKSAARRERIAALAAIPATLVFYESPGRLAEALADLAAELGAAAGGGGARTDQAARGDAPRDARRARRPLRRGRRAEGRDRRRRRPARARRPSRRPRRSTR